MPMRLPTRMAPLLARVPIMAWSLPFDIGVVS
jgi:hypothetical protein